MEFNKSTRVLAITDEVTNCDCCGKSNLKSTVVIENYESGEIGFFGSVCAVSVQKYAASATADRIKKEMSEVKANQRTSFYIANNGDRIAKVKKAIASRA